MTTTTAMTARDEQSTALMASDYVSPAEIIAQKKAIQECMKAVMKRGEHYGIIPGTEKKDGTSKPTLLKPGADTLGMMFRLRPEYEVLSLVETDKWIAITLKCKLYHINNGRLWGEGVGSANSREKRYNNQATARLCPQCNAAAIIKGREEYGGGYLCYGKKGGCGAKYKDDDPEIVKQTGQVSTEAIWDLHNTLWKMAAKRSRVDATLTATAASDFFTQDVEDLAEAGILYTPPPPPQQQSGPRNGRQSSPHDPQTGEVFDQTPSEKLSVEQMRRIGDLVKACGYTRPHAANLCRRLTGKANASDLTSADAAAFIRELETRQSEAQAPDERATGEEG